ncbi:MAG: Nif3-like dinuclear metal center hexameric protein [Oscillospiraceae bacterium]|nr:Nif3-like dinuclear metal center hexameric protein [Oscillospiraceae bacterium]
MKVQEVLAAVNAIAPFETQEGWDNSGLLVGSVWQEVKHVMVALDISAKVVDHAVEKGCDMIVSHHPVIFDPLTKLTAEHPVYQLASNNMTAICCHTPLDMVEGGINDLLVEKLREKLGLTEEVFPLEEGGLGRIVTLAEPKSVEDIAKIAKEVLKCHTVRYLDAGVNGEKVKTLAICGGSGSSLLELADELHADALLTGDVKHDRWYAAQDNYISLIDCGHYHTEIGMVAFLAKKLKEVLPDLEVTECALEEPVKYV